MMVDLHKVGMVRVQDFHTRAHDHYILLRHIGGLIWPISPIHEHVVERLVPSACHGHMGQSPLDRMRHDFEGVRQ